MPEQERFLSKLIHPEETRGRFLLAAVEGIAGGAIAGFIGVVVISQIFNADINPLHAVVSTAVGSGVGVGINSLRK